MKEICKDIKEYEGLYQVSNTGKVKSFRQGKRNGANKEYLLKMTLNANGYPQVTLYRSPSDRHKHLVHRLVAQAFIPNPENLEAVNHKDENPQNNDVHNLEWCTISYNNAYGTAKIRDSIAIGQKVQQLTLNNVLLATYESMYIASKITGIKKHIIKDCCLGYCQTGQGYVWRYAGSNDQ